MAESVSRGEIHVGRNIEALQRQLGIDDDALLAALGLSYNRLWDMKRRDWAQKKTVEQVASVLSELSGMHVTPEQVVTGRIQPDQFAARAVEAFLRQVQSLDPHRDRPLEGFRLRRLDLGRLTADDGLEAADSEVVRADTCDFVVSAGDEAMAPSIHDGDEVLGRTDAAVPDGEVAVVGYADADGVWRTAIRRVRREGQQVVLCCDNRATDAAGERVYPDARPAEVKFYGLVLGVWRSLRQGAI